MPVVSYLPMVDALIRAGAPESHVRHVLSYLGCEDAAADLRLLPALDGVSQLQAAAESLELAESIRQSIPSPEEVDQVCRALLLHNSASLKRLEYEYRRCSTTSYRTSHPVAWALSVRCVVQRRDVQLCASVLRIAVAHANSLGSGRHVLIELLEALESVAYWSEGGRRLVESVSDAKGPSALPPDDSSASLIPRLIRNLQVPQETHALYRSCERATTPSVLVSPNRGPTNASRRLERDLTAWHPDNLTPAEKAELQKTVAHGLTDKEPIALLARAVQETGFTFRTAVSLLAGLSDTPDRLRNELDGFDRQIPRPADAQQLSRSVGARLAPTVDVVALGFTPRLATCLRQMGVGHPGLLALAKMPAENLLNAVEGWIHRRIAHGVGRRITPRRVEQQLSRALILESGDKTLSWLVTEDRVDQTDPSPPTLAYYASYRTTYLTATRNRAVTRLVGEAPIDLEHADGYCGSHLVLRIDELREHARFRVRQVLKSEKDGGRTAWNTASRFTLEVLLAGSLHRNTRGLLAQPWHYSPLRSALFVSDKGSEGRWVPMLSTMMFALQQNQRLLSTALASNRILDCESQVLASAFVGEPKIEPEVERLFAIGARGRLTALRPSDLFRESGIAGLRDADAYRHLFVPRLLEAGVPASDVEALLGHANGTGSFALASTQCVAGFIRRIGPTAQEVLMEQTGWANAVASIDPLFGDCTDRPGWPVYRNLGVLPGNLGCEGRELARRELRKKVHAAVTDALEAVAPGTPLRSINETQPDELLERLKEAHPIKVVDAAISLINRFSERRRRRMPAAAVFPAHFPRDVAACDQLLAAFARYLSEKRWSHSPDSLKVRDAEIALSLALYSFIFDRQYLVSCVKAVAVGSIYRYPEAVVAIEIERPDRRVLEVDPLTARLIIGRLQMSGRLRSRAAAEVEESRLNVALTNLFAEVASYGGPVVRSDPFKYLSRCASANAKLELPIPLWAGRAGMVRAAGLNRADLCRVLHDRSYSAGEATVTIPELVTYTSGTQSRVAGADSSRAALRALRQIVLAAENHKQGERGGADKYQRDRLIDGVETLLRTWHSSEHRLGIPTPTTPYLLAQWVLRRATGEGVRKKNRVATVADYLGAIGHCLTDATLRLDVREADPEELLEIYLCVLRQAPPDARRNWVSALYSFHAAMVELFDCEEIDFYLLRHGSRSNSTKRRSKIITRKEYLFALSLLNSDPSLGESGRIEARAFFAIKYHFGLRVRELRRLRPTDIQRFEGRITIVSTSNSVATGKSRNAYRVVPQLQDLVPSESCAIDGLLSSRLLVDCEGEEPLFGRASGVPFDLVKTRVTAALRSATGDSRFRLHDLRHALATRLMLAVFTVVDSDSIVRRVSNALWGEKTSTESVRRVLSGSGTSTPWLIYTVSDLLGHGNEHMLLDVYQHATDILIGAFTRLRQRSVPLDSRSEEYALNAPAARLRVIRCRQRKAGACERDLASAHVRELPCITSGLHSHHPTASLSPQAGGKRPQLDILLVEDLVFSAACAVPVAVGSLSSKFMVCSESVTRVLVDAHDEIARVQFIDAGLHFPGARGLLPYGSPYEASRRFRESRRNWLKSFATQFLASTTAEQVEIFQFIRGALAMALPHRPAFVLRSLEDVAIATRCMPRLRGSTDGLMALTGADVRVDLREAIELAFLRVNWHSTDVPFATDRKTCQTGAALLPRRPRELFVRVMLAAIWIRTRLIHLESTETHQ